MPNKIDLRGCRFGRLIVVDEVLLRKRQRIFWLCRCDCGRHKEITGGSLRRGLTKSCGCYASETTIANHTKHGKRHTSEYGVWCGIKDRCTNKNIPGFANYGGRGIKVCNRWATSFENFFLDMGQRPSPLHSIERKNTNGNYEPGNCVWATRETQSKNTRQSRHWIVKGKQFDSCSEAAKSFGVVPATIHRWCNGFRNGGYVYRPRAKCTSTLKYKVEP